MNKIETRKFIHNSDFQFRNLETFLHLYLETHSHSQSYWWIYDTFDSIGSVTKDLYSIHFDLNKFQIFEYPFECHLNVLWMSSECHLNVIYTSPEMSIHTTIFIRASGTYHLRSTKIVKRHLRLLHFQDLAIQMTFLLFHIKMTFLLFAIHISFQFQHIAL